VSVEHDDDTDECRCLRCRRELRLGRIAQYERRESNRVRRPSRPSGAGVIGHVEHLLAAGMPLAEIARRADVPGLTLTAVRVHGVRLAKPAALAVLAVEP
jgi:hypothetical protein